MRIPAALEQGACAGGSGTDAECAPEPRSSRGRAQWKKNSAKSKMLLGGFHQACIFKFELDG
jgi:hypothetical protein